jgi:peptidylprolyl isomerase
LRTRFLILLIVAALAIVGCGGDDDTSSTAATSGSGGSGGSTQGTTANAPQRSKPKVVVPKGAPPKKLVVKDLIKGTGATAKAGDQVVVQYVGVDYKSGKQFDASWDRGQPFPFQLGAGQVIPGWDQGVLGMREGGRRKLIIPPELAYGAQGFPPDIPPDAALIFDVDLVETGV